jgi:DNA topoisomerase IB
LRRSNLRSEGIGRKRRGKGFSYHHNGFTVTDKQELARIRELVIPPAWRDVWISPDPRGHIQAVGVDAAGRKQYLYHPQWRTQRDREKFDRMLEVARALPKLRRTVARDLRGHGLTRRRVLAAAARMLDSAALRIGGETYAVDDPVLGDATFGLATLRREHVSVRGDRITICFLGKGGAELEFEVTDAELAPVLRSLLRRADPHPELLAFRAGRQWRDVRTEHVNPYLREVSGLEMTAKDFRTWHGTVAAAISLAQAGPPAGVTAERRAIAQAMRDVAERLGNTPAVARKSYVDARVIEHYRRGNTIDSTDWDRAQRDVLKLLGGGNGAAAD